MRMRWDIGGSSYSRGVKAFRPVRRLFRVRFYAVLDRLGPTHGTLRRLSRVLGCCHGAARVWRCAPQTDARKPGFDGA